MWKPNFILIFISSESLSSAETDMSAENKVTRIDIISKSLSI